MSRPTALRYAGNGEFFSGVPRRDLTEKDIARLSDATLARITAPGPRGKALYVADGGRRTADGRRRREAEAEPAAAEETVAEAAAAEIEETPAAAETGEG